MADSDQNQSSGSQEDPIWTDNEFNPPNYVQKPSSQDPWEKAGKLSSSRSSSMSNSQSAGKCVGDCPLKARQTSWPCDVLSVTVQDTESKASVTCDTSLKNRHQKPAKVPKDHERRSLMKTYDWVLEVVSEPIVSNKKDESASISLDKEYVGECPLKVHPFVLVNVLNPDDDETIMAPASWSSSANMNMQDTMKFPPKRKSIDSPGGVVLLEDVFAFFGGSGKEIVKEGTVLLVSCGVRDTGLPNHELIGLIRAYRKEEFELTVKIPAWRKMSKSLDASKEYSKSEDEKERTVKATNVTSTKHWDGREDSQGTKKDKDFKSESGGPLGKHLVETKEGSDITVVRRDTHWIYEKSTTTETDSTFRVKKKNDAFEIKPGIHIKRNGVELDITETANKIINTIIGIRDHTLSFLEDMQKVVPKVGFTMTAELGFLEGELTLGSGYRSDSTISVREYAWVSSYVELAATLKLITGKFTASVGIDVSSPDILNWFGGKAFELILKLALEISLDLSLSGTYPLQRGLAAGPDAGLGAQETALIKGKADMPATVYAQFKASVLGETVDAKLAVCAGIAGYATIIWPFDITYKLDRKAGEVVGYFVYPGKKPSPAWTYKFWDKATIKEGRLFHEAKSASSEAKSASPAGDGS